MLVRTKCVTHLGGVMNICIGNLVIIGSDNGLLPGWCQAIIWTNAGILLIEPLGVNFSYILIEIHTFSFKKICLKKTAAKWWPFCLGPNVDNSPVVGEFRSHHAHVTCMGSYLDVPSWCTRGHADPMVTFSDSKVHWANMGPTWGRQAPGGPHVGYMNLAIWVTIWVWETTIYLMQTMSVACLLMPWLLVLPSLFFLLQTFHHLFKKWLGTKQMRTYCFSQSCHINHMYIHYRETVC